MSASFLWTRVSRARDPESIFELLKRVPIFEGLGRRDLKAIERILHIRTYAPGEYIFREGDSGLGMYIIERGEVRIVYGRTGEEIVRLGEGDFFGEVALFLDRPRTASAIASVETIAWGFFQPDLLGLLETHPKIGRSVVLRLTRIIAERLDRATIENHRLTSLLEEGSGGVARTAVPSSDPGGLIHPRISAAEGSTERSGAHAATAAHSGTTPSDSVPTDL